MNSDSANLLTTGPFAAAGGGTPQTVRTYDKLDLLKPVARDSAGRRLYSEAQVPELRNLIARRIANRGYGSRR